MVALIAKLEGGQMRSHTLRKTLSRYCGVDVGAFSYGSLLVPGMADRGTVIGRYVSIGPNVRRFGAAHPIDELSLHPYWYNPSLGVVDEDCDVPRTGITIDSDSWIGANVVILPGCRRIGIGAIVGAGSVVTHDVPDFSVVFGVPARESYRRLTPDLREALLSTDPWQFGIAECRDVLATIDQSRSNE